MNGHSGTVMVEFATAPALARTLRELRQEGYTHLEVYEPYPSEDIDALLPGGTSPVRWYVLAGGVFGAIGAYFLQWYATRDYPLNVGGRPVHSWPAYIPVTFELTVLTAAIVGVLGLLWLARLPRLDHAVFEDARFVRASQDRFFLRIGRDDPRYTAVGLSKILAQADAISAEEGP